MIVLLSGRSPETIYGPSFAIVTLALLDFCGFMRGLRLVEMKSPVPAFTVAPNGAGRVPFPLSDRRRGARLRGDALPSAARRARRVRSDDVRGNAARTRGCTSRP